MTTSPDHVTHAVEATLQLPVSRACGLRIVERGGGSARVELDVTEPVSIGSGHLNGGELYALMDYAAYLALVAELPEGVAAITHDFHCAILSAAPRGRVVRIDATVDRAGRSLAFVRAAARLADGGKLVATATVTKSLLDLAVRMRHAPTS